MAAKDTRRALQARRELNRLLGLYHGTVGPTGPDGSPKDTAGGEAPTEAQEAVGRLELIASCLLPLKVTDERYPVAELARLAAEIVRRRVICVPGQGHDQ